MPHPALKVPMVRPLLIVGELPNPMLQVLPEVAFVLIPIAVAILSDAMALAIDELALIDFTAQGICCSTLPCKVTRAVTRRAIL
jgi:hypothetical protein